MSTESGYTSNAPTPLVTIAETVVFTFTSPPIDQPTGQGALLVAYVSVLTGAAAASLTVRIRLGSTTAGALVGQPYTIPCAAAAANQGAFAAALDSTSSYPAGQTYSVTVQQGAATGNGTMESVIMDYAPVSAIPG
jgi:hypothetical protein